MGFEWPGVRRERRSCPSAGQTICQVAGGYQTSRTQLRQFRRSASLVPLLFSELSLLTHPSRRPPTSRPDAGRRKDLFVAVNRLLELPSPIRCVLDSARRHARAPIAITNSPRMRPEGNCNATPASSPRTGPTRHPQANGHGRCASMRNPRRLGNCR